MQRKKLSTSKTLPSLKENRSTSRGIWISRLFVLQHESNEKHISLISDQQNLVTAYLEMAFGSPSFWNPGCCSCSLAHQKFTSPSVQQKYKNNTSTRTSHGIIWYLEVVPIHHYKQGERSQSNPPSSYRPKRQSHFPLCSSEQGMLSPPAPKWELNSAALL